jgi:hypothetical protein
MRSPETDEAEFKNYVYNVYYHGGASFPAPESLDDPRVPTLPEATLDPNALHSMSMFGNAANNFDLTSRMVMITFDHTQAQLGARITRVGTYVDLALFSDKLSKTFVAGSTGGNGGAQSTPGSSLGPALGPSRGAAGDYDYPPGSDKMKILLREALTEAALPQEWADWQETHNILTKESDGKVGIPNYTYMSVASDIKSHPEMWEELIWPLARAGIPGEYEGRSNATGLGQLLTSNVKKFYPGGTDGIGKALPEAVGFVKYVHSRYGDPKVAWSVYGKGGKGNAAVSFVNSRTGKTQKKTFEEGY